MYSNIAIFGSNGMLGNYVKLILPESVALTRLDYDILSQDENLLTKILVDKNIKIVINCAGLIKQRNPSSNDLKIVNTLFPILLARICKLNGIRLLHISTDCVFDGKKSHYTENDPHTATDDYGISKSKGEDPWASTLRTSIIGHETNGRNLSLLNWVISTSGPIKGFVDHKWNGVTCLQLAKVIKEIIDKQLWWHGVQHLYSPEVVSKYDLLCMIRLIYGITDNVEPIHTDPIDRSLYSLHPLTIPIPSLHDQIKEQYLCNI